MINPNTGYSDNADWSLIPEHMQGGLKRYLTSGIGPGHFLTAVLSNDLISAVSRADDTNINRLPDYVRFFYNYVHPHAFGSPKAVEEWIKQGGLR
jgi:hypothetical protein